MDDHTELLQDMANKAGEVVYRDPDGMFLTVKSNFVIPSGKHLIKGTINVPAGVIVEPERRGTVFLSHEPTEPCNCINMLKDSVFGYNTNGVISDLMIRGNNLSNYGIFGEAMNYNCDVLRNVVEKCKTGIYADVGVTSLIQRNICNKNREYGIYMENMTCARVENNRLQWNGKSGFYGTNDPEGFPFIGGFKFRDNECQYNTECGAEFYNVTDGLFEANDVEENQGLNAVIIQGRYNDTINVGVVVKGANRIYRSTALENSNALCLRDLKDIVLEENSFDGKFTNAVNVESIQQNTCRFINEGNMFYGDIANTIVGI